MDKENKKNREEVNYQMEEAGYCVQEPEAAYDMTLHKRQGEYTIRDYYNLPEDVRAELIDGVIYYMSAPTSLHQIIASAMHYEIKKYIEKKGGKCLPLMSPVDVRLDGDDKTMVQPDLLILCDLNKLKRWGIMGAPDFVLEVLSQSTRKKDCVKKVQKYADAGVKEYWVIDPMGKNMLVYNFMGEEYPEIYSLNETVSMHMYNGELQIDLGKVAEWIREYPE